MSLNEKEKFNISFAPALFYAKIPSGSISCVYPKERQAEIENCLNEQLKLSKFYAWKLLEIAVNEHIGLDFAKLSFEKFPFGKWGCGEFCFSISHSANMVAVALSKNPVGIDCQAVKPISLDLSRKILTANEERAFNGLEENSKQGYLLEAWCKKECLLKLCGEGALKPTQRETEDKEFFKRLLSINNEEYLLLAYGRGIDQNTLIKEIKL